VAVTRPHPDGKSQGGILWQPMIIAISGFKGGVAKTTTALHLAGFLAARGETLLIDADRNRSALRVADFGQLPFAVLPEKAAVRHIGQYRHIVLDTPGNPEESDLVEIARGADLMVLPTIPSRMSFDPLLQLVPKLAGLRYRALVTIAPSPPERDGLLVRDALKAAGLPCFETIVHRRAAFKHADNSGALVTHSEYDQVGAELLELMGATHGQD
jgi:chromosome partitioning protein